MSIESNKSEEKNSKNSNVITVKTAAMKFPLSEGALRHMIFLNKFGFADKVVVRLGRKVLLKEQAFIDFLNEGTREL